MGEVKASGAAARQLSRTRRLLLLTTSYPRWTGDPAGGFVAGFARAFQQQGWSVHVLAPASGEEEQPGSVPACAVAADAYGPAAGAVAGAPPIFVERLRYGPRPRLFYRAGAPENLSAEPRLLLQAPPFLAALAQRARRLQAGGDLDLIVGHWLLPGGLVGAWAAHGRTPCAAVCHSGDLWLLERLPGRKGLAGYLLQRCRRLLFVGGHLLKRFARLIPARLEPLLDERACVLPMGVDAPPPLDDTERRRLRHRLGLSSRPVVLFLGRFVPIKGVDDLLAAACGLDLQLVIAGSGPEEQRWREIAAACRLDCTFPGQLAGEGKAAWLQAADLLALPSRVIDGRSEGMPVVVLEALAAGLPVIASATGGLAEVVSSGVNGLLVAEPGPGEDPEQRVQRWRRALQDLLAVPGEEGLGGMRRAAARSGQAFRWPVLGPRLVEVLQPRSPV